MPSLVAILLAHVLTMPGCLAMDGFNGILTLGTITFLTQPFNITAVVGSNTLIPCTALETTDYPKWIIDGSTFQATILPVGLFATIEGLSIDGSVLLNYNSAWFQCSFLAYFGPPVNSFVTAKSEIGYLTVLSSASPESASLVEMTALASDSVLSETVQHSILMIQQPSVSPSVVHTKLSSSLQYLNSSNLLQSPLASGNFVSNNNFESMNTSKFYSPVLKATLPTSYSMLSSSAQPLFQSSHDLATTTLPANVPPQVLFNTMFIVLAAVLIALFALILMSVAALLCMCAYQMRSSHYLTKHGKQFSAGADQDQHLTVKENSAYAGIVSFQSASNVMTGPGVDHAQWQALQDQGVRLEENSAYAAIKEQVGQIQDKASFPIYAEISDL